MLASITPLGERGRQSRWGITVVAFLLGALAAGAGVGAALGALGSLAPPGPDPDARLALLALAAVAAILLDLAPGAAPGPRRQVDERWLDEYRGWVYGLGYGWQLGLGLTTVVSSAATYVAFLAALLSGSAAAGALILGVFGAVRGLTPLAAAGVRSPGRLVAFHRRLVRWRSPVRWGAIATQAGALALVLALS